MRELQKTIYEVNQVELLQAVQEKKNSGWRIIQICCSFVDGKYEVTYSFGKIYEIINYRLVVEKDEKVTSISRIYNSAVYYENEMHELFGLNVEEIMIDLHDKLYRIAVEKPFLKEEDK